MDNCIKGIFMQEKRTDFVAVEMLNRLNFKQRNYRAFNEFVNEGISNSKHIFQKVVDENHVLSHHDEDSNIVTYTDKMDDSLITQEYATVPFRFLEKETVLKKDGRKTVTTFYATNAKKPAKVVEYSASAMVVKTTKYDINGNVKKEEKVVKSKDGSGFKEEIDTKFHRKTVKKFNKYNIATEISSFVDDCLVFKLECDCYGNLKKESSYYGNFEKSVLRKEIVYHGNSICTEREYFPSGKLCSNVTKVLK